jgi:hypothetical protein
MVTVLHFGANYGARARGSLASLRALGGLIFDMYYEIVTVRVVNKAMTAKLAAYFLVTNGNCGAILRFAPVDIVIACGLLS